MSAQANSGWKKTWHGTEIEARARRANGRAIVGMAELTSVEMTSAAHVLSGDLKRSIHVAEAPDNGRSGENSWSLEVGSWLDYACVENNRGGDHRFADIGFELASPMFDPLLVKSWTEEGLE